MSFLIGLKKLVLHNLNFDYWMKMAMSLPFVPPNNVLDVFNNILLEFLENTPENTPSSFRYTMNKLLVVVNVNF
jgi:hypothetical protein